MSGAAASIADATRNLITVRLDATLTDAHIGGQYFVEFSGIGNSTDILYPNLDSILDVTWDPGVITITGAAITEPG